MKNPKDPHFSQPGNRLFRNAVQQRNRKANFSWPMVALVVTVLFVSSGGAIWYVSQRGASAPTAVATPAAATPTPQPTIDSTSATLGLATAMPAPEPTPKVKVKATPEPTPRPKTKTKPKAKPKKTTPPVKEVLTPRRKMLEPQAVVRDEPEKPAKSKPEAKSRPEIKSKAASKTKAKTERTLPEPPIAQVTEEPQPTPRVRFNMRPDSERSASTERVARTSEFPAAPAQDAAPSVPSVPIK